ncbi:c-type cytochrome domain-containing protein [Roseimaritima ulvae]|uniref:Planctomycete cytochrome C n=1 Tax=Roseimaritima ulvae TaxID=980254 RepID=A0A5B9R878_9BACT|nr:c-type cytochrome domain-containing protein [Roseimaritima ulvae]QEG42773.1 Planctomycete cytochrome C [Roseimaritima ulvae]
MLMFKRLCVFAILLAGFAAPLHADMTPRERLAVRRIADKVSAAGGSYQAGKFEQCGEEVTAAISMIETLMETADRDVYEALTPSFGRIIRASALLELEGVRVPPFARPAMPSAQPMPKPMPEPEPEPKPEPGTPAPDDQGVSFARDVAPILVQHCGKCHINGSKGNFSLASFAQLMKGPPEGVVVFAGDLIGSRLIETIETGDMPRGGKVPADQFKTLKDWVLQGAKFDGPSPQTPLVAYANAGAAATPAAEPTKLQTMRPTGKETVSFALDVAPLLVANCNGCHIDAMQVRGGLRMDTFAQLLSGGDSGAIITPGKGDESLLVQKLRGQAGDIMPAGGRPKLADEEIQLISTWITEGAAMDGNSEDQPLRTMAGLAWARNASHEELMERREQLAADKWKLGATPAAQQSTSKAASENFFIVGSASPETLEMVQQSAEAALEKIQTIVKAEPGQPMFKGRVTLYVLPKRYEYSEFSKMVERRSVPSDWNEHWQYDGIDAYVPLVVTARDTEDLIESRLLAPLTSLAISTRSVGVPRWFAEGIGRATTAKLGDRDNPQVADWHNQLPDAVASLSKSDEFLKGRLTPERADLLSFGLGMQMLDRGSRRQFDQLMKSLSEGLAFDQAFEKAFRGPPQAYVDAWLKYQASKPVKRRR